MSIASGGAWRTWPQFMTHLDRVSHELRQVLETPPEAIDVCDGSLEPHRFPNVDASLAPERRARIVGLEMTVQDVRPPSGDAPIQQRHR